MEFLIELEVKVPDGTPDAEVERRQRAEASAAAPGRPPGGVIYETYLVA